MLAGIRMGCAPSLHSIVEILKKGYFDIGYTIKPLCLLDVYTRSQGRKQQHNVMDRYTLRQNVNHAAWKTHSSWLISNELLAPFQVICHGIVQHVASQRTL